jgi:hypothetical protein
VKNFLYSIFCALLCISVSNAMEKDRIDEEFRASMSEEIDALKKTLAQAYKRVHEIGAILTFQGSIEGADEADEFDELYDQEFHNNKEFPPIADKLLDTWDMLHVSESELPKYLSSYVEYRLTQLQHFSSLREITDDFFKRISGQCVTLLQWTETWNDREMIRNQLVLIELMIPRIIEHYFFELVRYTCFPDDTPLSKDTEEFLRAVYQPSYFRSLGNFFRHGWFQDLCLFLQKTDFKESIETTRRNFVDFHQQRHALRKEEDALLKGTIVPLKKLLKEKEPYSRRTQDLLSLCWAPKACGFPYDIGGLKRAKIAPGLINNGLSILFRRYAIFELLERDRIKGLLLLFDILAWYVKNRTTIEETIKRAERDVSYEFDRELIGLYEQHREKECVAIQGQDDAKIDTEILRTFGYNVTMKEATEGILLTSASSIKEANVYATLLYIPTVWWFANSTQKIMLLKQVIMECEDLDITELINVAHRQHSEPCMNALIAVCIEEKKATELAKQLPWLFLPFIAESCTLTDALSLFSSKIDLLQRESSALFDSIMTSPEVAQLTKDEIDSIHVFFEKVAERIFNLLLRKEKIPELIPYLSPREFSGFLLQKLKLVMARWQITSKPWTVRENSFLVDSARIAPLQFCSLWGNRSLEDPVKTMYLHVFDPTQGEIATYPFYSWRGDKMVFFIDSAVCVLDSPEVMNIFGRTEITKAQRENRAPKPILSVNSENNEQFVAQGKLYHYTESTGIRPTKLAVITKKNGSRSLHIMSTKPFSLIHTIPDIGKMASGLLEVTNEYIIIAARNSINIYDNQTFKLIRTIPLPPGDQNNEGKIQYLTKAPDDYIMVACAYEEGVRVFRYSVKTGEFKAMMIAKSEEKRDKFYDISALMPINSSLVIVEWHRTFSESSLVVVCDITENRIIKTIARLTQGSEGALFLCPVAQIVPLDDAVLIVYKDMHVEKIAKSRLLEEEDPKNVESALSLLLAAQNG